MKSWQTYYRPQKFAQLHLENVREQMEQFAHAGNLPQVLLFTGPRGAGKTSTARIIAAMLNTKANEPAIDYYYFQKKSTSAKYQLADPDLKDPEVAKILKGESYLVVEIDAASHRGIDDVRALQEQIYLPPAMGKVMVYILDEVHMFTTEAFNALLKVLEEPPAHAFFILATTEVAKIPATVASRCQMITFRRASQEELLTSFNYILEQEKITSEPEALVEIAKLADGSFRDGVKYLQLVAQSGKASLEQVDKILLGNQREHAQELVKLVLKKDSLALVAFFAKIRSLGFDEKFFLTNLTHFLYDQLLKNLQGEKNLMLKQAQAMFLLEKLATLTPTNIMPFLNLELALLDIFSKTSGTSGGKK